MAASGTGSSLNVHLEGHPTIGVAGVRWNTDADESRKSRCTTSTQVAGVYALLQILDPNNPLASA
jgi:hypothetical protein